MEHLENEFRKRFSNQHLSSDGFDVDGLWDDINGELDHKPVIAPTTSMLDTWKLAAIVIAVLLIGIVGCLFLTADYNNDIVGNPHVQSTEIEENEKQENPTQNLNKGYTHLPEVSIQNIDQSSAINKSSTDVHTAEAATALLNDPISAKGDQVVNNANTSPYANNTKPKQSKQIQKAQPSEQLNTTNPFSNTMENVEAIMDKSKSSAYANNIKTDQNTQKPTTDQLTTINKTTNTFDIKETTLAKATTDPYKTALNTETTIFNTSESITETSNIHIARLYTPVSYVTYNSRATAVNLVNAPTYDTKSHSNPLAIYANFYSGVHRFTQTFSTSQTSDLVDQLNDAHKAYIGSSIGVGATAMLHNTWAINTGIEYHKLWNKLEIQQQNTIIRVKEDQLLKVWIQQSTGDTIAQQRGAANINVLQTRDVVHYNTYQRFTIPLEFGINKNYNRWSYSIHAGVALNFTTTQSGRTIDHTGTIVSFDTNSEIATFRSFDLGIRASMNAQYHLTDHISLYLSPQWMRTKGLSRGTDITSSIQQLQLNLGVRYRLK